MKSVEEQRERAQRRAAFIEKAMLASIQGGGFEAWRARRWHPRTIGFNEAKREQWITCVIEDATAAFEKLEPLEPSPK